MTTIADESKLPQLARALPDAALITDPDVLAGDGNLHPLLITPPGDDAARSAAQRAFDDIIAATLELRGTVSGEHGIGLLKRAGMDAEFSPEVRRMLVAVKQSLDPRNLFNPGKILA